MSPSSPKAFGWEETASLVNLVPRQLFTGDDATLLIIRHTSLPGQIFAIFSLIFWEDNIVITSSR